MIRLLISAMLILGLILPAYTQELGIKIEPGISTQPVDERASIYSDLTAVPINAKLDRERMYSLNAGLTYSFPIGEKWDLGMELLYSSVNLRFFGTGQVSEGNQIISYGATEEYQYRYLSLPVYFTYNIGKFDLDAGLFVSYYLNSEFTYTYTVFDGDEFYQVRDSLPWGEGLNSGIRLGVGYQISEKFNVNMALTSYGLVNQWGLGLKYRISKVKSE